MIPDKMMFNTPYHLNKNGVDYRTSLLIEDFQKYKRQYAICDTCIDKQWNVFFGKASVQRGLSYFSLVPFDMFRSTNNMILKVKERINS